MDLRAICKSLRGNTRCELKEISYRQVFQVSGYPKKKKSFYPLERDEQARKDWLLYFEGLDLKKLVFLDECSSFLNISPSYGWAHSSERVIDKCPKGKKKRVSLIAAIGLKRLLSDHCLIHPDSVDKAAFKTYLDQVLLPQLEPGTVLIMDNWTVHQGDDITEIVGKYKCSILYLPTYSPDFNPIEYLFSKIKSFINALRPSSLPKLIQAFLEAVQSITQDDIDHTFNHCGYLVQ